MNMNISTENFTSPEVHPSTNLTTYEDVLLNGFRTGLLSFNLLLGLPTHSYVLWFIARGRRIPSEFFNVNLTVCEITYSMLILFYLLKLYTHLELLVWFLLGLGVTGRPLFQCLMCVERYLAVVHPVKFLKFKPLRYRVICCTVVWIITLGYCLSTMFIHGLYNLQAWFLSLQFLFYFSIQLFCLVAVLRALKQSGPGERKREKENENHMKRRAFYIILITTVTFVVMFVPFIITGFLSVVQLIEQKEISLMWLFSLCCFILAGFVQPVLYLHRVGKLFCLSSP